MAEKRIIYKPYLFNSVVDLLSTFKIGGTAVTATAAELN